MKNLKKPIPGVGLFCECASGSCVKRLPISYRRYREIYRRGKIILAGHNRKDEVPDFYENGWCLVETRYMEIRQNQSYQLTT